MGIRTVNCSECGDGTPVGLPHGATLLSVRSERGASTDDPRRKWRPIVCDNGHTFYVHFEF